MKVLKPILISIAVLFLGFVVWMNVTPGHYRIGVCGCGVSYYTDKELEIAQSVSLCSGEGFCKVSLIVIDKFLLVLANFDYNK